MVRVHSLSLRREQRQRACGHIYKTAGSCQVVCKERVAPPGWPYRDARSASLVTGFSLVADVSNVNNPDAVARVRERAEPRRDPGIEISMRYRGSRFRWAIPPSTDSPGFPLVLALSWEVTYGRIDRGDEGEGGE